MTKESRVDHYLRQLERELADLDEEARKCAMDEVRAQIERAIKGGKDGDEVVRDLGPAKLTAKSYKKLCGGAGAESSPRWRKAFTVATVLFFAGIFIGGIAYVGQMNSRSPARFWTPTLKVDDVSGHIKAVEPVMAPAVVPTQEALGRVDLEKVKVTRVRVPFETAKLELNPAEGHELSWKCETSPQEEPKVESAEHTLVLNLEKLSVARCSLSLPAEARVEIRGTNGHVEIKKTLAPLDVQLVNGRVTFAADPARVYDVDVRVKNGLQDFFRRTANRAAIKVKVAVTNGSVKRE